MPLAFGLIKEPKRLSASLVLFGFSADLNHFAFLDEQGDVNDQAVLTGHGLLDVASGVTFDGGRSLENFDGDGRGKVNRYRAILNEENLIRGARNEKLFGVFDSFGRNVVFFESVRIGENVVAISFVRKLEGFDRVVEDFEADSDTATHGNLCASLDGAQFHLDVGGVVGRGADETFENDTELAVVAHNVLLFDTINRDRSHKIKGEDKPSRLPRSSRTCVIQVRLGKKVPSRPLLNGENITANLINHLKVAGWVSLVDGCPWASINGRPAIETLEGFIKG